MRVSIFGACRPYVARRRICASESGCPMQRQPQASHRPPGASSVRFAKRRDPVLKGFPAGHSNELDNGPAVMPIHEGESWSLARNSRFRHEQCQDTDVVTVLVEAPKPIPSGTDGKQVEEILHIWSRTRMRGAARAEGKLPARSYRASPYDSRGRRIHRSFMCAVKSRRRRSRSSAKSPRWPRRGGLLSPCSNPPRGAARCR